MYSVVRSGHQYTLMFASSNDVDFYFIVDDCLESVLIAFFQQKKVYIHCRLGNTQWVQWWLCTKKLLVQKCIEVDLLLIQFLF